MAAYVSVATRHKQRRDLARLAGSVLQHQPAASVQVIGRLGAEGCKLRAEGDKLYAEGDILFFTAVIAEYGNVIVKWTGTGCQLGNGVEFKE